MVRPKRFYFFTFPMSSTIRLTLFLLTFTAAVLFTSAIAADRTPVFPLRPPPRNDIIVENRVPIPMRDGVILYADIYRPVGDGKHPVLVSRTPYSTERFATAYAAAVFFARRGYVYVFQDVRGRHESEGVWDPARYEFEDGYDTGQVGALAAEVMAEAILRAVRAARGLPGIPAVRDLPGGAGRESAGTPHAAGPARSSATVWLSAVVWSSARSPGT
jgi:hypothetical protein